jgi:hypothetical protein
MMMLKQLPDASINKICNTFVGSILVTSIISENGNVTMDCNYCNSGQIVRHDNEKTNVYKSFTTDYCINFNMRGYSNNKSDDFGIEKVTISEEKLENLKKIETIAALNDNWNANGAKAFSPSLIKKVRSIITLLDIQPEVFPTACESLQLEYDKQDGSHMEIELVEGDEAEVFLSDNEGHESLKNIQANFGAINEVVNDFYG